jgi:hypothetical protein
MNKEQIIYQLKCILEKIRDYNLNSKIVPEFTWGEEIALKRAIDFMKDKNNDSKNIDKIKQDYNQKLKEEIQERCDHDWGYKRWVDSCFYTCTCRKCGKVEEFYERD